MRKLKNILITGGAGFIGCNFIHYLFGLSNSGTDLFGDVDGYNKSAVEKYLKLYENKERYFECKGTAENSGKKQFRFQMRLDQRRQRSSWA